MKPDPLTPEERRWIKRCRKLFKEAPYRFEFVTIGDADFAIIDGQLSTQHNIALEDGGAASVTLARISLNGRMHGVSG